MLFKEFSLNCMYLFKSCLLNYACPLKGIWPFKLYSLWYPFPVVLALICTFSHHFQIQGEFYLSSDCCKWLSLLSPPNFSGCLCLRMNRNGAAAWEMTLQFCHSLSSSYAWRIYIEFNFSSDFFYVEFNFFPHFSLFTGDVVVDKCLYCHRSPQLP